LNLGGAVVDIRSVDVQPSKDGGVLVLVQGLMRRRSAPAPSAFVQTFFLAQQENNEAHYYLLNDVFRAWPENPSAHPPSFPSSPGPPTPDPPRQEASPVVASTAAEKEGAMAIARVQAEAMRGQEGVGVQERKETKEEEEEEVETGAVAQAGVERGGKEAWLGSKEEGRGRRRERKKKGMEGEVVGVGGKAGLPGPGEPPPVPMATHTPPARAGGARGEPVKGGGKFKDTEGAGEGSTAAGTARSAPPSWSAVVGRRGEGEEEGKGAGKGAGGGQAERASSSSNAGEKAVAGAQEVREEGVGPSRGHSSSPSKKGRRGGAGTLEAGGARGGEGTGAEGVSRSLYVKCKAEEGAELGMHEAELTALLVGVGGAGTVVRDYRVNKSQFSVFVELGDAESVARVMGVVRADSKRFHLRDGQIPLFLDVKRPPGQLGPHGGASGRRGGMGRGLGGGERGSLLNNGSNSRGGGNENSEHSKKGRPLGPDGAGRGRRREKGEK
jgi:hypothetical protein